MSERFLEGRSACVTGGGSGMGRAIAGALARAGAEVAIGSYVAEGEGGQPRDVDTYYPSAAELEAVRDEIAAHGVAALARPLDVRSDESVESFVSATQAAFGKIDILINAAGCDAAHPLADHPDDLWHKVIDTNLSGCFRMVRRTLGGMIERRWGRIVIIASTAASTGAAGSAAYCASKSGLVGLMRCAALEGAAYGVTCNAISPGYVDTPMVESHFRHKVDRGEAESAEAARAEAIAFNPQGAFLIQPAEVADVALFLCSDAARRVNMQDMTVSGGSLW